MKQEVTYILGLGHSGSTILDILLSHHSDVLGLGETVGVLHNKNTSEEQTKELCSCSEPMTRCPFWSAYYAKVQPNDDDTKKYHALLETSTTFARGHVVDSSKKIEYLPLLKKLHDEGVITLRVLFLLKDARAWSVSMQKRDTRINTRPKSSLYYQYIWYKKNKEMLHVLESEGIEYMEVKYKELCMHTEEMVQKMCTFMHLDPQKFSLDNTPESHVAFGNRAKKQEGRLEVVYDDAWKSQRIPRLVHWLLPQVCRWNKKHT